MCMWLEILHSQAMFSQLRPYIFGVFSDPTKPLMKQPNIPELNWVKFTSKYHLFVVSE